MRGEKEELGDKKMENMGHGKTSKVAKITKEGIKEKRKLWRPKRRSLGTKRMP